MNLNGQKLLICNCEKSMALDAKLLQKQFPQEKTDEDTLVIHEHLCRSQLAKFEKAAQGKTPLLVACTQEAPLFAEIADETDTTIDFVNIRENAGWCEDKSDAMPKIAALLKAATIKTKPARLKTLHSDGLCIVYGKGQAAYDAAKQLAKNLSVTLILETKEDEITLDGMIDFPIYSAKIESCTGHFGAFTLNLKNQAGLNPSSRTGLEFGATKNNTKTECSLILDLSNVLPLVQGHKHRDGYKRIDPNSPTAIFEAILEFQDMVGEFEKPIYVSYDESICAHSRSKKVGCSKCLDNCPTSAVRPNGDGVLVDADICGGCGTCHAICPTGAMDFSYPNRHDVILQIQTLAQTYLAAKGQTPVLLIHDSAHGNPLISALARFGKGLPARVIPFEVHAPTSIGHVELAASLVSGFHQIIILGNPNFQDEYEGLLNEIHLMEMLLEGLKIGQNGEDEKRIALHFEQDPDALERILHQEPIKTPLKHQNFVPLGTKREVARTALALLAENSAQKVEAIALPKAAPYGKINVEESACTLCMACVSACPSNALMDNPESPQLRFVESACVQCGLCSATCPENAISLTPQYNLLPNAMQPQTLYEEEPFCCISCGTPFASRSVVERIKAQLGDQHWMYLGDHRTQLIEMCNDCRIETQANASDSPMAHGERPKPRTTQDYIDAEKTGFDVDDFIIVDKE